MFEAHLAFHFVAHYSFPTESNMINDMRKEEIYWHFDWRCSCHRDSVRDTDIGLSARENAERELHKDKDYRIFNPYEAAGSLTNCSHFRSVIPVREYAIKLFSATPFLRLYIVKG